MKKITAFLLAAMMILSFSACSVSQNGGAASDNASAEPETPETLSASQEFLPFECSPEDEINYDCTVNGSRFTFENRCLYITDAENQRKAVFKTEADFIPVAYIKDALYLSTVENLEEDGGTAIDNQRLYRIVIDENGNYGKNTFALVMQGLTAPSFIPENNRIIMNYAGVQDKSYYSLDTSTGTVQQYYESGYDVRLDDSDLPEGCISKSEAETLALNEAQNEKYYSQTADYKLSLVSEYEEGTVSGGTILWKNIDFSDNYVQWGISYNNYAETRKSVTNYMYERTPQYCYMVQINAEPSVSGLPNMRFIVYVNAQTGGVSLVTFVSDLDTYNSIIAS